MAEATSSNLRPKHSSNETSGGDRISELPDEVLCHILSFLTTTEAVGTSLLSSRWRYVWTCVPILHFEEDYSFVLRKELVDRVMTLHRLPCLKKFYLSLSNHHDRSHVNAWISAAVMRNVEELDLDMFDQETIELPQILYTNCCEKLVVLKLCHLYVPDVLAFVCFPSLKIFHIHYLDNFSNDFVEKMLSVSPVLEEFSIYEYDYKSTLPLNIHSSSLKKLTIFMGTWTWLNSLDVVAPKLEVLMLFNLEIADRMMKLPSLVEAKLHVRQCFVKLQSLISNVKVLHLYLYLFEEYFESSNYNFVSLGSLTHLDVSPMGKGCLILPTLLKCSPHLEVLVVHMRYQLEFFWCSPEDVPQCMLCLKRIEFKRFRGSPKGIEMIEYFLKHSMVLEEMKIAWLCCEAQVKRLLMFPWASSRCQIVLSPPIEGN